MTKDEFMKKYESVKNDISDLYRYYCLTLSGFDNETAFNMLDLMTDVWLKDESGMSISKISDYLYELYDEGYDIDDMTTKEILDEIYEREF